MEGSRKRKKPAEMEFRNFDCNSPFPGDEPAPEAEGWRKVKDPRFNDGRLIWVALPKNEIERMPCVYVVERRAPTSRYLCIKCNFMYWGSKKRVKEHLRGDMRDQAGDVKRCTVRITPEEEDTLQKDDDRKRVCISNAMPGSAMAQRQLQKEKEFAQLQLPPLLPEPEIVLGRAAKWTHKVAGRFLLRKSKYIHRWELNKILSAQDKLALHNLHMSMTPELLRSYTHLTKKEASWQLRLDKNSMSMICRAHGVKDKEWQKERRWQSKATSLGSVLSLTGI
jgi:hypothetical protein